MLLPVHIWRALRKDSRLCQEAHCQTSSSWSFSAMDKKENRDWHLKSRCHVNQYILCKASLHTERRMGWLSSQSRWKYASAVVKLSWAQLLNPVLFGKCVSHPGPLWREGRLGREIEWHTTKAWGYPSTTEGRRSLTKTRCRSLLLDCVILADKSPHFNCVLINPLPFFVYLLIRFWN